MTTSNQTAFLDMIAFSEGTQAVGHHNGYDVIVGSTPASMRRIDSFDDHPRVTMQLNSKLWSSAAGRYQITAPTWAVLKLRLKLPDFSPGSQDKAALELIREKGAIDMIDAGKITDAIIACAPIWASFPGAGYNQHENSFSDLIDAYKKAGGTVS
ncbi:MAG: glycoside hydrolase family 104 protein [Syntrophomonadaceae bacterium]|nr:glycoside hydrolase family 104 protein [Syntrophomonadaceae bacterium]